MLENKVYKNSNFQIFVQIKNKSFLLIYTPGVYNKLNQTNKL